MLQISHTRCKHQTSTKLMFWLLQTVFLFFAWRVIGILLNPLAVLIIIFFKTHCHFLLPVRIVLKILQEILLFTCSLVINTHLFVWCLKNSDPKSKTVSCLLWIASSCLVDTMSYMRRPLQKYLVLHRDS